MSSTVRVNINVSQDLHTFYKEQADKAGVAMSAFMAMALLDYKERKERIESEK